MNMDDLEYYKNVREIINELLKNAKKCAGIDFQRLNETGIETNRRIKDIKPDNEEYFLTVYGESNKKKNG